MGHRPGAGREPEARLRGLLRLDHPAHDERLGGILRVRPPGTRATTATAKGKTDRTIAGVAYWFPHLGTVSTVLLFDFEQVDYEDYGPVRSNEKRWALHMLVNF